MLRVSSDGSRFYKNTDARHRVIKKQTRGIAFLQKHRREASRYKNKDAKHRVSTKPYTI
ncbi:MAG: hypothetical protein VSS75_033025 [Candidatus Parabeggiatoa sp.]|nr:hypothetical protein [Candidatus Parabeggiatoa sp.]